MGTVKMPKRPSARPRPPSGQTKNADSAVRDSALSALRNLFRAGTGLALYIFAHVTLRLHAVNGGWTKLQWDQLLISAAMNAMSGGLLTITIIEHHTRIKQYYISPS